MGWRDALDSCGHFLKGLLASSAAVPPAQDHGGPAKSRRKRRRTAASTSTPAVTTEQRQQLADACLRVHVDCAPQLDPLVRINSRLVDHPAYLKSPMEFMMTLRRSRDQVRYTVTTPR